MSRAAGRMNAGRVMGGDRGGRASSTDSSRDFGFLVSGFSSVRRASQLKWADRRIKEADRPAALEYLAGKGERGIAAAAMLAEHWGMEAPAARKIRFPEGNCKLGDRQ